MSDSLTMTSHTGYGHKINVQLLQMVQRQENGMSEGVFWTPKLQCHN